MERMTEYEAVGGHAHAIPTVDTDRAVMRLAAYEDTGLSPESVEALKLSMMGKAISEIKEFNGLPIKRLCELAAADKDGRVVLLPCKVGDTVYQLRDKRHALGVGISPRTVSVALVWTNGDYALTHQGMDKCCKRDLGKTWFLTREEAEAALKEV